MGYGHIWDFLGGPDNRGPYKWEAGRSESVAGDMTTESRR